MQTDGRPAIYNFENEQNRQDVRLLKNGATSLKFYALMLPGQTFGTDRAMMSLHIGDTHFTYTPGTPSPPPKTPATNWCASEPYRSERPQRHLHRMARPNGNYAAR